MGNCYLMKIIFEFYEESWFTIIISYTKYRKVLSYIFIDAYKLMIYAT